MNAIADVPRLASARPSALIISNASMVKVGPGVVVVTVDEDDSAEAMYTGGTEP